MIKYATERKDKLGVFMSKCLSREFRQDTTAPDRLGHEITASLFGVQFHAEQHLDPSLLFFFFPTRRTKIEKEKKEHAKLHGMIRTEISGAEIAEEMEKERRFFQLQMCEVRGQEMAVSGYQG